MFSYVYTSISWLIWVKKDPPPPHKKEGKKTKTVIEVH